MLRVLPYVVWTALWLAAAESRSLWLDEYHTLFHARAESLSAYYGSILTDNHPPLAFLPTYLARLAFGENWIALRLPGLAFGLAALFLVARVARRLPDGTARVLAPWLFVLSSFALTVFTELRGYGLLLLATVGVLDALLDSLDDDRPRWRLALWVALGLHAHYFFFFDVAALGLVALWRRRPGPVLPFLLGGLLFLPWFAFGMWHQLGHGLKTGADYDTLLDFFQSLGHLFFLGATLAGATFSTLVAFPGAGAAALGMVLGAVRLARVDEARRRLLVTLVAVGVLAPGVAWLGTQFSSRVTYNWRYVAGSVGPVVLILAAGLGVGGIVAAVLRWFVPLTMAAVTVVVAASPGREDWRGATRHVLANARDGDAVLARPLWHLDPARSPTGYDYYAGRLGAGRSGPAPVQVSLSRWGEALRQRRVWVVIRSYTFPKNALETLRKRFADERAWDFGVDVQLHLFSKPTR